MLSRQLTTARWPKRRIGGAIYILPNLLTSGNLFFGFFAIIKALKGEFAMAANSIFLATVFDMLDGRVARLTHSTSEFGLQYDSLCDLVSFGLAPAILIYLFGLHELGRLGWIASFIFLAFGALRLARFNVQSYVGNAKGDFSGLPIPMAALVIASLVGLASDVDQGMGEEFVDVAALHHLVRQGIGVEASRRIVLLMVTIVLGTLMVSNFAYRSFKSIGVFAIKPFRLLAGFVILGGMIAYDPMLMSFIFVTTYALSGPLEWLLGWKKSTDDDEIFEPVSPEDSLMEPLLSEEVYMDLAGPVTMGDVDKGEVPKSPR